VIVLIIITVFVITNCKYRLRERRNKRILARAQGSDTLGNTGGPFAVSGQIGDKPEKELESAAVVPDSSSPSLPMAITTPQKQKTKFGMLAKAQQSFFKSKQSPKKAKE
jgi:hypothetical protein